MATAARRLAANLTFEGKERYIGFHFSAHTVEKIIIEPAQEPRLLNKELEK